MSNDDKRHEYIREAEYEAGRLDDNCAPCVWWVCDWTGHDDRRRIAALYDALMTERKKREQQEKDALAAIDYWERAAKRHEGRADVAEKFLLMFDPKDVLRKTFEAIGHRAE